jgi:hypothetical protein
MGGAMCIRKAGACVVLLLEFLLVFVFLTSWQGSLPDSQHEIPPAPSYQDSVMLDSPALPTRLGLLGRPLFPYSVIPRAVENVSELGRAIANDPIAAAHYQGFRLARARVILVNEEHVV